MTVYSPHQTGAAVGGVETSSQAESEISLDEISTVNVSILIAEFSMNPKTTPIINYALTEGSEGADEHYEKLTETANPVPKHNLTLVLGDFNAHLMSDTACQSHHDHTNHSERILQ